MAELAELWTGVGNGRRKGGRTKGRAHYVRARPLDWACSFLVSAHVCEGAPCLVKHLGRTCPMDGQFGARLSVPQPCAADGISRRPRSQEFGRRRLADWQLAKRRQAVRVEEDQRFRGGRRVGGCIAGTLDDRNLVWPSLWPSLCLTLPRCPRMHVLGDKSPRLRGFAHLETVVVVVLPLHMLSRVVPSPRGGDLLRTTGRGWLGRGATNHVRAGTCGSGRRQPLATYD